MKVTKEIEGGYIHGKLLDMTGEEKSGLISKKKLYFLKLQNRFN